MRRILPLVIFSLFLLLLLSLRTKNKEVFQEDVSAIGCGPSPALQGIQADASGRYAPVFPGWGNYSYKVKTGNDSAQFFFDQGLSMYYSYHLAEALASFKEAARRDTACAMAYWGQALAMGPYYNNYFYKMPATVLPVLEQMNRIAVTGEEKDLVETMNKRYSADTSDSRRKELNRAYSEDLAVLIKKYPADPDIKALYVDAVMLEHVWDFWTPEGQPKEWTPELVSYCDEILHDHPSHPAALHYQIHLVEASLHPEKALHSADVLQELMPGVAHMVHMSSHMYQRNGLYTKGIEVNERASGLQARYDSMARNLELGTFAWTHFDGVEALCAMNVNMFGKGLQTSQHLRNIFANGNRLRLFNTYFQYLYMLPVFTCIRSGKWKQIMESPAPDNVFLYAVLLDEFGKGMACVHLDDLVSAHLHLERLRTLAEDNRLAVRNLPFNAPIEGAKIAEGILAGEIYFSEKKYDEAIHWMEKAVSTEDGMIYREPKDWPIPARHFLGAYLLKLNRAAEAEKVYRQDLVFNPGNGWAFLGLSQSLRAQHKKEADLYEKKYKEAFAVAEEVPPASVY